MKILLKWLLYMIPAFIAQGVITYLFRPRTVTSLAFGTPIFLLLSAGNLIVYNFLFIPKTIRTQVKEIILGRSFGHAGANEYEDILTQIVNESKARQAAYDGYLRSDLVRLHAIAVQKESRFKKLAKLGQWFTYLFLLSVSAYNFFIPGYQLSNIYLEWALGLAITTSTFVLGRRQAHWGYQKITLKRCLEKCEREDQFRFDDDL